MKSTETYTEEIFTRGNEKIKHRKRTQRIAMTICASVVLCFGLGAVFIVHGLEDGSNSLPSENSSETVSSRPADNGTSDSSLSDSSQTSSAEDIKTNSDRPVIWDTESASTEDYGICEWNGKSITSRLYEAFEKEPSDSLFAVTATGLYIDKDFVYGGKTLSEYEADREAEHSLNGRLHMLLKDGDSLKYGEMLYNGGAPNGEKWAESYYNERIEIYGEEFLSKYIVNGEFLKDKVQDDIDAMSDLPAAKLYDEAVEAYLLYTIKELAKSLDGQGIPCDLRESLVMYITESQLAELYVNEPTHWIFGLAVDFNQPQDFESFSDMQEQKDK